MTSFAAPPVPATVRMRPRPWSVQATKAMVLLSRDHAGHSSRLSSSPLVSRRGSPPAIGLTNSFPRLSKTTCRPSGETAAKRTMLVVKRSGDTAIFGCGASSMPRVSATWNGITAPWLPSASTRRILPPAQNTIEFESGVQSMFG